MPTYLLFIFMVCSPWLIFLSYIFYFEVNKGYKNPIIKTKKELKAHLLFLGFLGFFCFLMFISRITKIGTQSDISPLWFTLKDGLFFIPKSLRFLLFLTVLLGLVIWGLFLSYIYKKIKLTLITLFLYFYKYEKFKKIAFKHLTFQVAYMSFLRKRLRRITNNNYIVLKSMNIWPLSIDLLERNIFKFLVPYLYIFDLLVENGLISKVFFVLPWIFVYSLIRSLWIFFDTIHTQESWDFSELMYEIIYTDELKDT